MTTRRRCERYSADEDSGIRQAPDGDFYVRSGPRTEKHKFVIYNAANGHLVSGATVTVILATGETFTGTSANAGLVILPVGKGDSTAHVQVVMTGFCTFDDDSVGIDASHTYIGIQPGC